MAARSQSIAGVGEFTEFSIRLPRALTGREWRRQHRECELALRASLRVAQASWSWTTKPDVADLFRQHFRREARQGNLCDAFLPPRGRGGVGSALRGNPGPHWSPSCRTTTCPAWLGLQLLAEIKQRFPDLPVMMVTAYGDEERRPSCRRVWRCRVHHQASRF